PSHPSYDLDPRWMFLLCRPFFIQGVWQNDSVHQSWWGLLPNEFSYVGTIENADVMLLPFSINDYFKHGLEAHLKEYNYQCIQYNIKAFAFLGGDWGIAFPEFSNINYFRMGGFRSQLSTLNQGFPAALSDHYVRLYGKEEIEVREKQAKPIIGFCGHATLSFKKRLKENMKFVIENFKRALRNPFRNDWEPLFASAYQRAILMKSLKASDQVHTNFIYRKNYRAGYKTPQQLEETTFEYYENIRNSDYVLCVRGGGNFSIRLYETLMMGRIPVFVNTDCILPQTDKIDWKKHMVIVEWEDRKAIAEIVSAFHSSITPRDFKAMQWANRELWKNELSVVGCLTYITNKS
ncbi:MAG: exostosin family protein, partial [Bacteroidetes bacterium]|nr:exostosin family protein [Bacteroidota bacterium]